MKQISIPLCNLALEPNINSSLETQLLYGERVEIMDEKNKWFLVRSTQDNYKGWIDNKSVSEIEKHNYQVTSLASYIYIEPNIKSKPITKLFFNSKIKITQNYKTWYQCEFNGIKGYIYAKHLEEINLNLKNNLVWVDRAMQFLNTTYLWGGKSYLGLDCSALVQLAVQSSQIEFPRNTNDQFNSQLLEESLVQNIKKGVLVFWDGHVAIAINEKDIIHANAFHMKVNVEPLVEAKKRINSSYGKILGFKEFVF